MIDELARAAHEERMGAVKTTPPGDECAGPPPGEEGTEEASFGAEMAGPTTTVGQAIQAIVEQDAALPTPVPMPRGHEARVFQDGMCYGISPAEDMRKAFDEASASLTKVVQEDAVNSPAHYNEGGVECIDAIAAALGEAGFISMCHGTAIKYLWRARHKALFQQDLKKAIWYLRMAIGDDPRQTNPPPETAP